MLIKDETLLTKKEHSKDGKITYKIKAGKFLGDVFNQLPNGIIDKTETGIGGTSCELDSTRNSIVVEPYNFTAYSKSLKKSELNKYTIHYYGNYTIANNNSKKNKKLNTLNIGLSENDKLEKYLIECNKNNQPYKIICITDQLLPLKKFLNSLTDYNFGDFHLVLDEIDSIQEQSGFREVMEICFDVYKEHPKLQRTVISATLMEFHDEEMKNEQYSTITYDKPSLKDIVVIPTGNIEEEIITQIIKLVNTSKDKIVIACNNLEYCIRIATYIETKASVYKRSVSILCSSQKEKKVGKYFKVMGPNGVLPSDINFITAAYFNGCDINEKYHNIVVANGIKSVLRLSPSLIYQICGRGRKGLLSNKLLLKIVKDKNYPIYTFNQLVGTTDERKSVNDLIKKLEKSINPHSVKAAETIKNVFNDGTSDYPAVSTIDKTGNIVPSYFKIDSRLEQQKTHANYQSYSIFTKALAIKFQITHEAPLHLPKSALKLLPANSEFLTMQLINQLEVIDRNMDYESLIKIERENLFPIYPFQSILCDIYNLACKDEEIDISKLVILLKVTSKSKRTITNELKCILLNMEFNFYCNKIEAIKKLLQSVFAVNSKFSKSQLTTNKQSFAEVMKSLSKIENLTIKIIASKFETNPNLVINSLVRLERKHTSTGTIYKVVDYSPFDIRFPYEETKAFQDKVINDIFKYYKLYCMSFITLKGLKNMVECEFFGNLFL